MKIFIILITIALETAPPLKADDSRFRFNRMEGVTGIPTQVAEEDGKATTVVLSEDSDPSAMAVLDKLIRQEGVWGSLAPKKDPRGITWDQGIILVGDFVSEIKTTPDHPNQAAPEPYREFKISGISIEFPFARWVETDKSNPIATPHVVEFHFELRSLIPDGLIVAGMALDLKHYESRSPRRPGLEPPRSTAPSLGP